MKKKILEEIPQPSQIEMETDEKHLAKINEKWDALRKIADEDLQDPPINDFHLPTINNKWLGIRSDWVLMFLKLDQQRDKLERSLIIEYRKHYDLNLDKNEEALFIRTDPRYIKIYEKCKRTDGVLQFITGVLKAIENKYYLVKEYNIRQRYLKGSLD